MLTKQTASHTNS